MSGAAPVSLFPPHPTNILPHLEAGLADHIWSIEELVELL
jgi:hypothetical protein